MELEKTQPIFTTMDKLRPDTKGHNLTVKVLDCKVVSTRPGRGKEPPARLAECLVGDETGVITFAARNEQIDLMQPGSCVTLRNAHVQMFRGAMRLAVDQWGKVEAADPAPNLKPNKDYNLSLIEYELVQIPDGVQTKKAAADKASSENMSSDKEAA